MKGKKKTPIFWHPIVNKKMMNAVHNINIFNTEEFRDDQELNLTQSNSIFESIANNTVDESNQSKHFKVKRVLQNKLLTSMDISDTKQDFVIDFENNKGYSGHILIVGGTGSGKTHSYLELVLRNLNGPKEQRRNFLIFSAEYEKDKTLEELRKDKYAYYITGVDVSEQGQRDSQWSTNEDFFQNEIKLKAEYANAGTIIIGDDYMDSCCPQLMRTMFNRLLRTARHDDISIVLVLHSIRSGTYSSQAYNSVKWIILYPRSQKGKITQFLNKDLGLTLKDSRNVIREFSQTGRQMFVRLHSPELILNKKRIQLL